MEDLYKKIIESILREENIKKALEYARELFNIQGFDVKYYLLEKRNCNVYSNAPELIEEIEEKGEKYIKKELENEEILIKYNFEYVKFVLKIKPYAFEYPNEIENEIEIFAKLINKSVELEVYRIYSFINPFFFEASKVLHDNSKKNIEGVIEDFNLIVNGILGIEILKIEKSNKIYFIKKSKKEFNLFKYKDLNIEYIVDREIDKMIEIEKILKIVFFILYSFLEYKQSESQQKEFLEYQITSKENLKKLNTLLEKSLYKMTFISNLYTKLSKTREVKKAVKTVEQIIAEEVGYKYLLVQCGDEIFESGEKFDSTEIENFEENLMNGSVKYKIIYGKDEISSEEQVYINLIFNHSKIEIENMILYKYLEELATIDGVTNLYIHRYFIQMLEKEIEDVMRYNKELSLVMMDIDNFKKYNDTYGHLAGDKALFRVGEALKLTIRKGDIPCRYGGEEFIVVLPFANSKNSTEVAERIRKKVEEMCPVTVSIGVATYQKGETKEEFIKRVDEAMYEAKRTGKNKVVRK